MLWIFLKVESIWYLIVSNKDLAEIKIMNFTADFLCLADYFSEKLDNSLVRYTANTASCSKEMRVKFERICRLDTRVYYFIYILKLF